MNIKIILLRYIVSAGCLNAKQEITEYLSLKIFDCCDVVVAAITISCLGFSINRLKVIYHPLYSMNKFVTNKSKLPQDGAQVLTYMR